MARKTKNPALPEAVRGLANTIINNTPDGSPGYDEAAGTVSEIWDQFEANGATVADMDRITGYIRYAKFEGFCTASPIG